ncbi:hypothetical protein [Sphingobacterium deserti]|uniref:Uncharacterized protein n=1 Tax=Sphingobacterium deserti TaxID=1229276 RepID=A0A0B8T211_9SPHI|nr:hypothetical protein [Sphingobacterium deserti]KGE15192.1 hypothetical protein DI53_0873 [Sphingobacterium deserti]
MKLTPLNIVLACVLTWIISELGSGQLLLPWWQVALLIGSILLADILFRVFIKDIKKLWILEIVFVLVSGILAVGLRIFWN